jgi:hypothetical protein
MANLNVHYIVSAGSNLGESPEHLLLETSIKLHNINVEWQGIWRDGFVNTMSAICTSMYKQSCLSDACRIDTSVCICMNCQMMVCSCRRP